MKSFVVALMLIAVVSCASKTGRKRDVTEVFQGEGWSKGADGYTYDIPKTGLPDLKIAADPVEPEAVEQCPNGGSGSFCCINGYENEYCCENGADNQECALVTEAPPAPPAADVPALPEADYLPPVQNDYLPPKEDELRDYLPPVEARRRLRLQRRYRFVRRQ